MKSSFSRFLRTPVWGISHPKFFVFKMEFLPDEYYLGGFLGGGGGGVEKRKASPAQRGGLVDAVLKR